MNISRYVGVDGTSANNEPVHYDIDIFFLRAIVRLDLTDGLTRLEAVVSQSINVCLRAPRCSNRLTVPLTIPRYRKFRKTSRKGGDRFGLRIGTYGWAIKSSRCWIANEIRKWIKKFGRTSRSALARVEIKELIFAISNERKKQTERKRVRDRRSKDPPFRNLCKLHYNRAKKRRLKPKVIKLLGPDGSDSRGSSYRSWSTGEATPTNFFTRKSVDLPR